MNIYYFLSFFILLILFAVFLFILFGWRRVIKGMVKHIGKIILTDRYQENVMEMLPGLQHMGIQNTFENSLRAETGKLLHRPLGSSKKWPHLDPITFIPAQTSPFPIDRDEEVDVAVTIGPKAKKPMNVNIPLMISGMGYGLSLSDKARLSLAEAASNVGTALNSGEGGILPEEVNNAGKYILQFSRTEWAKEEDIIKRADMIEIKLGQGAVFGMGWKIPQNTMSTRANQVMGLKDGEEAVVFEHFFDNQQLEDLKELVDVLRDMSGGVPIGVKIGAGGKIEEDIDHLIDIGVDFITVDGAQGGTYGAPPLLADDIGIPTFHAVTRAANYMEKRNVKRQISLIASAGLFTPGHCLKVLALGADAVYLGSAILFAVSHNQNLKAFPFEPPTQVVWDLGKFRDEFKTEEGAKAVEKYLTASTEEIKVALRAMGKRSLRELSKKDLVSYDKLTANILGIPFSFEPWKDNQKEML
ncbi:FMN-binding glutamate synthase family protein [Bacillus sp. EB600]|uniref:FMN-binding glutamate synthase family protein n=1 Tax=Bacillus sp. EB600 TaxID=2806345 RepID=UPI00210CCD84|nr:FMN-binding glutamate synthase family protein [Bacillus sp. EB600]MCQ6278425.1 FMN-binding glutamate synthase family protein [Bacillus sp. EB600]